MKRLLAFLLLAASLDASAALRAVAGGGIAFGSSLPATCTVGQLFFNTSATAGQNIYECAATNVWTQQLNSGVGGASIALDNLVGVSINASLLAQTGLDLGSAAKPWGSLYIYGAGSYGTTSFKLTGTPTAARTVTLPDASMTVAGSASALTSGRVPFVTTGGLLIDNAALTYSAGTLTTTTFSGALSGNATTASNIASNTGTTTTVLHGNAAGAPSFGSVALADMATQATNTVVGNATAGSAAPTALSMTTCSTSASAVNWTTNTGFGCNTAVNAAQLGGATFSAPGTIGNGTPGAATFSSVSNTGTSYVWQSAGVTGTLAWAPGTSNKTITLPNGTTDFTATGGTSQVLKQTGAGAAITVARLACADLSDAASGCSTSAGTGTVTTVSVVTANGVSGSVANATTTPAITLTLGAITPTTVNGNTFTTGSSTYTGTAAQTYTFPTTTATIARTDAGQTFTGVQTMTSPALTTPAVTTSITTPSATFALVNTTATTVNFAGGASTALNIGNASGANAVSGATTFNQAVSMSSTLGVGTASPAGALDVSAGAGTGLTGIRVYNNSGTGGYAYMLAEKAAGGTVAGWLPYAAIYGNGSNYPVQLVQNNAVALTVAIGGAVTIPGATTLQSTLAVTGATDATAYNAAAGVMLSGGVAVLKSIAQGGCRTAGTLSADNNGLITCTISSERYKHDIAPLDSGLATIALLTPIRYHYNADRNMGDVERFGFSAEKSAAVDARLATTMPDGTVDGFDHNGALALAVKAIQELKAEVDALKAR